MILELTSTSQTFHDLSVTIDGEVLQHNLTFACTELRCYDSLVYLRKYHSKILLNQFGRQNNTKM